MTEPTTRHNSLIRLAAPLAPYVGVTVGLIVMRSVWAALLIYQAEMLVVLTVERQWWRAPKLLQGSKPLLIAGTTLVSASTGALLWLLGPLGVTLDVGARATELSLGGLGWPIFIGAFVATNPWLEELYWRGYLAGERTGVSANDLLFAGYHIIVLTGYVRPWLSLVALAALTVIAWAWRRLNDYSDGLMLSALSHFSANVTMMLAAWALSR